LTKLLEILSEQRILLILDHCENLLDVSKNAYDPEYDNYPVLFEALAASNHRSSVLVISHVLLPNVNNLQEYHNTVQIMPLKGLTPEDIHWMFQKNNIYIDLQFARQIYEESAGHPAL